MQIVREDQREEVKTKLLSLVMIEPFSGCWLWEAGCFGHKYPNHVRPAFYVNGKQYFAYRISFEVFRHEIPDGLKALHSCDTSICINPAHIFLGTNRDNMRDAWNKGKCGPNQKGLAGIAARTE